MRDDLSDDEKTENTYDPAGEISMYLEAMADAHGGEGAPKAADNLTGNESLSEILDIAIGLEKESILFYIGLQDMVPERLGRDKIVNIIAEERSHITTLAQKKKSL
jgi:rubrerythrin